MGSVSSPLGHGQRLSEMQARNLSHGEVVVGWDFLLFLKTLQFHIAPRNVAHSGVHPHTHFADQAPSCPSA